MQPESLPSYRRCFVCGQDNEAGLKLRFYRIGDLVSAEYNPLEIHARFDGIIHGGIISAVLDEAMFWAVYAFHGRVCVTAELTTRLKRKVSPHSEYRIVGRSMESSGRLITAEASLLEGDSRLCAEGKGKFFPLSEEESMKLSVDFAHQGEQEQW